jgi:hypothetical protein
MSYATNMATWERMEARLSALASPPPEPDSVANRPKTAPGRLLAAELATESAILRGSTPERIAELYAAEQGAREYWLACERIHAEKHAATLAKSSRRRPMHHSQWES